MRNLVGNSVDHYQILVKIRETPTRILYRAYNSKAQNFTALEIVKTSGPEPALLQELVHEQIRKTAELEHPNIAHITDTGVYEGLVYIVYNFSPNQPLRRLFNRTYPWREMARELVSITHALAYAHNKGIIHGSLHPASIVLDQKRNPFLFDFGFEHLLTNYLLAHSPGSWINRWGFEYRAPEQLGGEMPDARSDIYALGMMMHEWLTGNVPLLDATIVGTLQLRKNTLETIDKTSSIPSVVEHLIQKCIAPNPADRYQSMQEVYLVLERAVLDMSLTQKMVEKPFEIPKQRLDARRWVTGLSLIGVLATLVILFINLLAFFTAQPPVLSSPAPSSFEPQGSPTLPPVQPSFTTTQEVVPTETAQPAAIAFPAFQDTLIYSPDRQSLHTDNVSQMIMLAQWGMGDVSRLASSPDGKQVAVASSIGVFIFDVHTLALEKYTDRHSWVTAIDFSPDSQTLATGDRDGLIQLWNTETWEKLETSYFESGHTKAILDLAFSPDGTKLASVSLDNSLIQWNVTSNDGQKWLSAEVTGGVQAVAYSGDGTRVVTAGNDFQIRVWDANSLKDLQTKPFSSRVVDISSVKGSNLFVLGGRDQKVMILDLTNGITLIPVGKLRYPLASVALSQDSEFVAAGDINGGIMIWDIRGEKAKVLAEPSYPWESPSDFNALGSPHSLAFSADGKSIFSGLDNGIIRSIDTTTGKEVSQDQYRTAVKKLVISHDSQYLITQHENDLIRVWSLWNGRPLYQRQGEIKDGDPFSQDDRMFAVASGAETVNVYETSTGNEIHTFQSDHNPRAIRFIREDNQLAVVYDGSIRLWSISSGEELITEVRYEGTDCLTIYDVNNDPVVSITKYFHVIEDQQNQQGLCDFPMLNRAIAINEEQALIAYGVSSRLAVKHFQSASGETEDMENVNRKNIVRVALSADGALVAAAYDDYTIHLWDIATRQELYSLYGHTNSINDLQFTPDGKLLVSSSLDGTIRLWGVPH